MAFVQVPRHDPGRRIWNVCMELLEWPASVLAWSRLCMQWFFRLFSWLGATCLSGTRAHATLDGGACATFIPMPNHAMWELWGMRHLLDCADSGPHLLTSPVLPSCHGLLIWAFWYGHSTSKTEQLLRPTSLLATAMFVRMCTVLHRLLCCPLLLAL